MTCTHEAIAPEHRLRCCLGLTGEETCCAVKQTSSTPAVLRALRHSGLEVAEDADLRSVLQVLESHRSNPNRVSQAHLEGVPGLRSGRLGARLRGRPYYSLSELESVAEVPGGVLSQVFDLSHQLHDPLTGRTTVLRAVPGKYLVARRADLEEVMAGQRTGFVEVAPRSRAPAERRGGIEGRSRCSPSP